MEEIKNIYKLFISKKIHFLIIAVVCLIIGTIYSYFIITPKYQANTSFLVVKSDIDVNKNLIYTYSELIKSNCIIEEVNNNLNLKKDTEKLKKEITVKIINNTEMVVITVVNENSDMSQNIANEITNVLSKKVEEIYHINNIYIIDKANVEKSPFNINHIRDFAVIILIFVFISVIYLIILSTKI